MCQGECVKFFRGAPDASRQKKVAPRRREIRMNFVIQKMRPEHWPRVRDIYLEGIATGHATFETEAPGWERWDSSHLPFARLVALAGGDEVAGWAALGPVSGRKVYAGVAEVSVYVPEAYRAAGVGGGLRAPRA